MKSNEEYQDNKIWANFSYVIQILQSYIKQDNIDKGFRPPVDDPQGCVTHGPEPSFDTQIANLHGEVSEAWEAWRQWGFDDMTPSTGEPIVSGSYAGESPGLRVRGHGLPKPEGVGSKFADILIRLLDSADICGIDLAKEVRRKMQYNATRSYRHGGKNA